MVDFPSNSQNKIPQIGNIRPEKKVSKVVTGDIIVKKKSLGKKMKEILVEADFKDVIKYIIADVLLPATRNTIVDVSTKGIERLIYGDSAIRRRNYGMGPRITYHNPINRSYSPLNPNPQTSIASRSNQRFTRDDYVIPTREEAELVVERMTDIIDTYGIASVADLCDLLGVSTTHVDNKWGWTNLGDADIKQIREGYLLDFPLADPIN